MNLCSLGLDRNVFGVEDIAQIIVLHWIVLGASRGREQGAFSVGASRGVPKKFVEEG